MRMRHQRLVGFALLLILVIPSVAQAAMVEIEIKARGETVGTVTGDINSFGLGGGVRGIEGVTGGFTVTKKKPDGSTMSLDDLEAFLGQDHLNWFQKVTKDSNPPNDCNGKPLTPPYIDPPNGGYCGPGTTQLWGDNRPWYWNETPKPAGETRPDPGQLGDRSKGSMLEFEDFPTIVGPNGPIVGATAEFATFLISDYGNQTYEVLGGGFSWGVKVVDTGLRDQQGKPIIVTNVTSLTAGAAFTDEYAKEISAFGYAQVPESSTLMLLVVGSIGFAGFAHRRVSS